MANQKKTGSSHASVMLAAAVLGAVLFFPWIWRMASSLTGDFDFYEPPILPLTAVSGGEHMEVERDINLDFTAYTPGSVVQPAQVAVTDRYTLMNPTAEPLELSLAYPVYGQLWDGGARIPTLTVDGSPVQATLRGSLDAENQLRQADNFADFQRSMAQKDFLADALRPVPNLDTPVKVYHISDFTWPSSEDPEDLRVGVIYSRGSATTVWKYGTMDMTENEELGIDYMLLHAPTADTPWIMDEAYLIVQGPDVVNLTIQGYRGYEVTESAMVPGVSATVETYESTLGEMVTLLAGDYLAYTPYDADRRSAHLTADFLAEATAKCLADSAYHSQAKASLHSLSELFHEVETGEHLLYQTFSLTVPAGESVTVTAQFFQAGSCDIGRIRRTRDGFDLATTAGSSLTFTNQTATLTGAEQIRILDQNCGFDLKNNVTEVTLDPQTARYYLTVGQR